MRNKYIEKREKDYTKEEQTKNLLLKNIERGENNTKYRLKQMQRVKIEMPTHQL